MIVSLVGFNQICWFYTTCLLVCKQVWNFSDKFVVTYAFYLTSLNYLIYLISVIM